MCPQQLPCHLCNHGDGRSAAKLLLGGPLGRPQTRFAFSCVDESSRHSIALGLDLAAFGARCMFCGDAGQLRPYTAITLLAKLSENQKVTSNQIARPQKERFSNVDVDIDQGPPKQCGDSQHFAMSSVLQFVLYRTRCTICVRTHVFAAHWWLSENVKLGLIWGSVVHCDVFVLVCCDFCMLGNVHLLFLEVLDTHLVKVQRGGVLFLATAQLT